MPTITLDHTDPQTGYRVHGSLTIDPPPPPPPPAPPLRLGVDFPPFEATAHRGFFPNYRYRALFADPTKGEDWSDLSAPVAAEPAGVLVHPSAKTVNGLSDFLDALNRDIYLTYWHEPMGDIDPADYRTNAEAVADIIRDHPNGHRVLLQGPCLTRYWIDPAPGQGQGDPEDWWYDGATAFFNDCYTGGTQYRTPANMFDTTISFAAAKSVPWAVRELGGRRITSDVNGSVRAQWLRDLVQYAEEHDCRAMAWFCNGATGHLENYPAELAAWQQLLSEHA